jgi:hypothetical protein
MTAAIRAVTGIRYKSSGVSKGESIMPLKSQMVIGLMGPVLITEIRTEAFRWISLRRRSVVIEKG